MIYIFCCWPPGDWFSSNWFLFDESYFKLSISSCKCLICLFNSSSLAWFVNEMDGLSEERTAFGELSGRTLDWRIKFVLEQY